MDVLGDWGGVQTEDKKIKKGKSMVLCRTVIIPGAVLKNPGERSEPEKKAKKVEREGEEAKKRERKRKQ